MVSKVEDETLITITPASSCKLSSSVNKQIHESSTVDVYEQNQMKQSFSTVYSIRQENNSNSSNINCNNRIKIARRFSYCIKPKNGEDEIFEQINDEKSTDFTSKTHKDQISQKLHIILPHIGLILLSIAYTIVGAAIFHHLEMPYEIYVRNETFHRIETLKQQIINNLWILIQMRNSSADVTFESWSKTAHLGINDIIRDVFIDYTKNYMTPDEIIKGTGPVKWSFGSSIFFSWTAITTIGYGHIVPRTDEGRIACLMYSLFGIPLMLVTIADIGRFLSAGIVWVNSIIRVIRLKMLRKVTQFCIYRCRCLRKKNKKPKITSANNCMNIKRQEQNRNDTSSEDISEINLQKGFLQDTQIERDDLRELYRDRRISVLFVLIVLTGYTAGGAFLMQIWENWTFMESFYFCFVTVTTIGFGDIVPQNVNFLPATLMYIIIGLIITTMCIDLVGSEYIRDIHFYGRSLKRGFATIGDKVVHLGEVLAYSAFLQKKYGFTEEEIKNLAEMPEEYLFECLINGRKLDLSLIGERPFVPYDIYYFKWIDHPNVFSLESERMLSSVESLDLSMSKYSPARTLTPREYYQRILLQHCKLMKPNGQQ